MWSLWCCAHSYLVFIVARLPFALAHSYLMFIVARLPVDFQLTKRDLVIMDESNTEIVVTLWGAQAETIDAALGSILAIKNCRVGDYNGVCMRARVCVSVWCVLLGGLPRSFMHMRLS